MRVSVNLATRPFVELRPFFLRLRLVMGVLAVVALALAIGGHAMAKKLAVAQGQVDDLHRKLVDTEQEKNRAQKRMHEPANAAVLERAHFLNLLFLRKSFAWTAVMMDLETVLPVGVQVTSIEPAVSPGGDVVIRLRVAGDRDRAVQLVRNLERSQRFLHPRLAGETSQSKENGAAAALNNGLPAGVDFDILADYNPLPADEPYRYARVRVQEGALPVRAGSSSVIAPTPLPAVPVRPAGAVYPRDGVVLKPYAAPAASSAPPAQPIRPRRAPIVGVRPALTPEGSQP